MDNEKVIYKEEGYIIQGAIFEVYKELGSGFLEAVFQESLEREFDLQGVPYFSQPEMQIAYKGKTLKQTYRPDFTCYGKIIVELKAVKELTKEHKAQILNYLKVSKYKLGFLVNFGAVPKVEIERVAL